MEFVKKLETTLAGWYKQVPFHLPAGGRKWLSENVWWLVLIGAVLSALGIIVSVQAYWWGQQVIDRYRDVSLYYGVGQVTNTTMDMTAVWVGVVFYVAVILLEVMAISPLKNRQKKGWNLLFMAMLVGAVAAVVSAVLALNFSSLISTAVGLVIGGYFLFEIHDSYSAARAAKKAEVATDTPKAEK